MLVEPNRVWVEVQDDVTDFISMGRTVFAKHVIRCDVEIRPEEEVVVVDSQHEVVSTFYCQREKTISGTQGSDESTLEKNMSYSSSSARVEDTYPVRKKRFSSSLTKLIVSNRTDSPQRTH